MILIDPYRFTAGDEGGGGGNTTPYRYYRLHITKTVAEGNAAVQDIELRGSPDGADVTDPAAPARVRESSYTSVYGGSRAFDDGTGYTSQWISGGTMPQWVRYDFAASPVAVQEYAVTAGDDVNGPARAPEDFTLEGSDDGVTWTVLDARTGQTGWAQNEQRVFTIE